MNPWFRIIGMNIPHSKKGMSINKYKSATKNAVEFEWVFFFFFIFICNSITQIQMEKLFNLIWI